MLQWLINWLNSPPKAKADAFYRCSDCKKVRQEIKAGERLKCSRCGSTDLYQLWFEVAKFRPVEKKTDQEKGELLPGFELATGMLVTEQKFRIGRDENISTYRNQFEH